MIRGNKNSVEGGGYGMKRGIEIELGERVEE